MGIEYELTLAGETPVERVAERAMPDPAQRPTGTPPLLAAALQERYGFEIVVRAGRDGYFGAESDAGRWEWEPAAFVSVTFFMDKDAESDWAVPNLLDVVGRVLDTGSEDAALILNDNWLLFARTGGGLVKHRRTWWDAYPGANDRIPG